MSFPKQSEIELPLLKTLQKLGGKAEPKELYPRLATSFPQLTEQDLAARSVGGKIHSAARRLTSSVVRSKAIMTTGYF
jgi:hypothetical protein